jgi:Fe-S-cluster-containing dehydrogenase component/anaerobic selenocysteine-containing dehydrogenase
MSQDSNSPIIRSLHKGALTAEERDALLQRSGDEFPHRGEAKKALNRRDFMKITGATLALSGLGAGCRFLPQAKLVPYVKQPEDMVASVTRHFATVASRSGFGVGMLAASYEGRPIKLEGGPNHPASLGSIDSLSLAELWGLYDPDRIKLPQVLKDPATWTGFDKAMDQAMAEAKAAGKKVVFLTETVSSRALADELLLAERNGAEWIQWEPVHRDSAREGAILAFGKEVHTYPKLDEATVVLGVDSDFLLHSEAPVRYARDIAAKRRSPESGEMSRLWAVEAAPTLFGAMADHRLPLAPSRIGAFLAALAQRIGVPGVRAAAPPEGVSEAWLAALAEDMVQAGPRAVVMAGDHLSASAHALVHAIHDHLGSFGVTMMQAEPVLPRPASMTAGIGKLADMLERGEVHALVILGGNPVFSAPAELGLGEKLAKAPFTAHLTGIFNETTKKCRWALPESHFLECWADATAFDGTMSIQQPLIEPLYDSRGPIQLLALVNRTGLTQEASVRKALKIGSDAAWREALAEGVVKGSAAPTIVATVQPDAAASFSPGSAPSGVEVIFRPDPTIYDGRYANCPWLQELPKPITNMTWDNAAYMSQATADQVGLDRAEVLGTQELGPSPMGTGRPLAKIDLDGRSLELPAAVNLGMADNVVLVHFGYGRKMGGQYGTAHGETEGGGFDVYQLRSSQSPWTASGQVAKGSGHYAMANTQFHNTLDVDATDTHRAIFYEAPLTKLLSGEKLYEAHSKKLEEKKEKNGGQYPSMYEGAKDWTEENSKDNYQWAMTIDLNLCTGCNACVTACQSENNIPAVGKQQVMKGREMHWIRIDRYYMGDHGKLNDANPPIRMQPLACVHCELAPCEPVCPVAATVHSHEGLNQMVYNRCVGTRYCSNNCPYKVRRFNFLAYTQKVYELPTLQMAQNPDVSVRTRGVMEKCTYCVQRINKKRIAAKLEGREIADGEVVTACQQACPSQAIVFGDMRSPDNEVSKLRSSKRSYLMLEDLNTKPRTSYLMKITNPHPALAEAHAGDESHG